MDGSLLRSFGFQLKVPTLYQAARQSPWRRYQSRCVFDLESCEMTNTWVHCNSSRPGGSSGCAVAEQPDWFDISAWSFEISRILTTERQTAILRRARRTEWKAAVDGSELRSVGNRRISMRQGRTLADCAATRAPRRKTDQGCRAPGRSRSIRPAASTPKTRYPSAVKWTLRGC